MMFGNGCGDTKRQVLEHVDVLIAERWQDDPVCLGKDDRAHVLATRETDCLRGIPLALSYGLDAATDDLCDERCGVGGDRNEHGEERDRHHESGITELDEVTALNDRRFLGDEWLAAELPHSWLA